MVAQRLSLIHISATQEPRRQLVGPLRQVGIARTTFGFTGRQPLQHRLHPAALLRPGEPGRHENDDPITLSVGTHRATATGAAPDLDGGLGAAFRASWTIGARPSRHRAIGEDNVSLEGQRHVEIHALKPTWPR